LVHPGKRSLDIPRQPASKTARAPSSRIAANDAGAGWKSTTNRPDGRGYSRCCATSVMVRKQANPAVHSRLTGSWAGIDTCHDWPLWRNDANSHRRLTIDSSAYASSGQAVSQNGDRTIGQRGSFGLPRDPFFINVRAVCAGHRNESGRQPDRMTRRRPVVVRES
jgi:hypothetical protein